MQVNKAFSHYSFLISWLQWHHGGLLAHFTHTEAEVQGGEVTLLKVTCSGWPEPRECGSPRWPGHVSSPPPFPWPPPTLLQPPGFLLCWESLPCWLRSSPTHCWGDWVCLSALWGYLCCPSIHQWATSSVACCAYFGDGGLSPLFSSSLLPLLVTLNTDRNFRDKKYGWSVEELLFVCRMMVPYWPCRCLWVTVYNASYSYIWVLTHSFLQFFFFF